MNKHSHSSGNPSVRLVISILLNAIITLVEISGGILSNSMALISDAIHNLSDTLALMLSWIANNVGGRKPNSRRTFGYKRFEILSAFLNASILTAISIYLMYVAILRFVHPEPVKTKIMLIIAIIGLAANLGSMLFLRSHSHKNLNIKAAYVHLLGDTLSSLVVIGGAVIIYFTRFLWVDPLLTIIISLVIIYQAYKVLRESVDILMQSTPESLDLSEIKLYLEKIPLIRNIHHVHCWRLQDNDILFEAHIETTKDLQLSETGKLLKEVETQLRKDFHITHTTLQVEFEVCDDKEMIRQP